MLHLHVIDLVIIIKCMYLKIIASLQWRSRAKELFRDEKNAKEINFNERKARCLNSDVNRRESSRTALPFKKINRRNLDFRYIRII